MIAIIASVMLVTLLYLVVGTQVVKLNDYILVHLFDQSDVVDNSSYIISLLLWPILIPFLLILVPIRYYELKNV